jgi:DNA-binding transcriptional ArsR family regulator
MRNLTEMFKLLTDEHRVRIIMLLDKKELSVCQLMGIIGVSQPLVSRNLSLFYKSGFLNERRDGKLRFYSIRKDLSGDKAAILELLRTLVKPYKRYKGDLAMLKKCTEFQKKAGRCDMETLKEFMKIHNQNAKNHF